VISQSEDFTGFQIGIRVRLRCADHTRTRPGSGCFRYHRHKFNDRSRSGIVEHEVSVILKNGDRYNFPIGAEDLAAFNSGTARTWIAEAFLAAGLETPNPMGKLLLVDEILLLAQNFKQTDYDPLKPEVRQFMCAALRAMERPSLTIDLAAYKL
jgi:hypothetical protein